MSRRRAAHQSFNIGIMKTSKTKIVGILSLLGGRRAAFGLQIFRFDSNDPMFLSLKLNWSLYTVVMKTEQHGQLSL